MGKLTVTLAEIAEQAFRERVKTVYGNKMGALSIEFKRV
jgi:hypothetical protein